MRRCLANIQNMFSQADKASREAMIHALYGYDLM